MRHYYTLSFIMELFCEREQNERINLYNIRGRNVAFKSCVAKRLIGTELLHIKLSLWHSIFDRQPVKYPTGYMTGQILSPVKRAWL